MTDWLEVSIICPGGVISLPNVCCFSEAASGCYSEEASQHVDLIQ